MLLKIDIYNVRIDDLTKFSGMIYAIRCTNNIQFINACNYGFFLIFQKIVTFFSLLGQYWSKKVVEKNFWTAASISFDEGILRSSQSETFKKGHKINTDIFYRENANFFPINELYKIFQNYYIKFNMKRVIKNIILVI